MSYPTATPRIASYLVIRKAGKVAFVLRSNTGWMDGRYGLVAGKVEIGESYKQAAVREAKEEAGIYVDQKDLKYLLTMQRLEGEDNDWVDIFFEPTKWKGEPYNAEPEVHSELAWLDPKNLPDNMIPSIRFAMEQIEAGNVYCEYGLGD